MDESPVDLDTLVQRLRAAAAEHHEADTDGDLYPMRPQAWVPPGASPVPSLPWGLVARARGAAPFWLADDEEFVQLAYRQLLGRTPDEGGAAHWLERLRQHAPRAELLAELALSREALALRPTGAAAGRWLARLLLWAVRQQRLGLGWLARGVLRRTERWLRWRAQGSALGLTWEVARTQAGTAQALQAQLAALQADMDALAERQQAQASHQAQTLAQQDHLRESLTQADALWRQGAAALHARLQAMSATALKDEAANDAAPAAAGTALVHTHLTASAAEVDVFLAALEAAFRGDTQALREQLAQDYLPRLQSLRAQSGDGPCLDLGCGRGVWLQVLRDAGFAAVRGVDLNAAAVAEAQAQGLPAEHGDALAWLRAQAEGSALAITAFHLMEHLPFTLRLALVGECARVLRPGGLLILETPNPENLWVATHTFHHDPTHSQPLTPDSLAFLVTYCGLQTLAVPRLHPYPADAALPGNEPVVQRLNHMTCGGQDFAVIAQKPAPAVQSQG